jgi:hypothetical protein
MAFCLRQGLSRLTKTGNGKQHEVPLGREHGPANLFYEKFIFVLGSLLLLFLSNKLDTKNEQKDSVQEPGFYSIKAFRLRLYRQI